MQSDVSYVQTITHSRHLESFHTNHSFRLLPLKRMEVDGRVAAATSTVLFHSYGNPSTTATPAYSFHSFISLSSILPSPSAVCLCHILYLLFILLFLLFLSPRNVFCQFWSSIVQFLLHHQFILTQSCRILRNKTSTLKTK